MDLNGVKPIELNDKQLFDDYFRKFTPEISEFTFTNLYIWRNHYDLLFKEWKDHLLLFSYNYLKTFKSPIIANQNPIFFFPPIGQNQSDIMIEIIKTLEDVEFHRVPQNITSKLKQQIELNDVKLEILEDRNNWDYVYDKESIMNLTGNKHRQNRRWLQKFLDNYNYKFNLLTEDWVDKCRELQLKWCLQKGCDEDDSLMEEQKAINEALDNFSELRYKGGIICLDGECVAYTFGEMLNSNTLVIHIEKAHMEYEGSYQAISNLFLKNCCENTLLVNREQDLGIPGLRRAKESYKPIRMVEKSIIYKKPN
ncbi:MAG: DUF2156 domain-containing protein [Candidatus Hermodarchaeota archaeon]